MRLESLQVSGFGHLHGLTIHLTGPLTVLYGPNEAGKSTLLGFVRAMLFGIPNRTYGAQRYEPVNGTVHGGMLTIRDEEDAQWVIERYAQPPEGTSLSGTRGDRLRITVSDPAGNLREVTQDEMQRKLLSGISKNMFKQLFAISLTELQEVGALQSEEMNRFLFHAGIGGGNAILRGEKKLITEMDKLYRPRGRNQEIAQLVQAMERLEADARTVKSFLPRYHELLDELAQTNAAMAVTEEELVERNLETAKWQRAVTLRPDWLQREAALVEYAAIPAEASTYPEQGIVRWNSIQEEKERLMLDISELNRRKLSLQQDMDAVIPNEDILLHESSFRLLTDKLTGYEDRQKELAQLRVEIASLNERLGECLRSIHPDWTITQLRAFAGTVGERESVRQYLVRFSSYDKEMDALRNDRFKLERDLLSLESAYTQAAKNMQESEAMNRKQFAVLIPEDRLEIRILWNEISMELDRWRDSSSHRIAALRAAEAEQAASVRMRSMYARLLGGASVLTIVLPVILWLTSDQWWGSVLSGVVLLGFDLLLWSGMRGHDQATNRRSKQHRSKTEVLSSEETGEARLNSLVPKLIRHPLSAASDSSQVSHLSIHRSATLNQWEEEERGLRRLMESWQLWAQRHEGLEAELANCRRLAMEKRDELQAQEREMSRREEVFAQLSGEWEQWLEERHLSAYLSPEAALDVFRLAEQGRDLLSRLDALHSKERSLQAENTLFENEAAAVGIQSTDLIFKLRQALIDLDLHVEWRAKAELISAKIKSLEEEQERLHDRLDRILDAERHLLQAGGAENGEEFLRKGADAARYEELDRSIRQWNLLLFGTLEQEKTDEIEAVLRTCDEDELVQRAEWAKRIKAEVEAKRVELQEKRGRLLQEMESLESRGLEGDLLQQLAQKKSQLGDALDKYAVMAVCHELIARVRKIYEEERQPAVLQAASNYLQQMTGGTYRRILMKMGNQELLAEHAEHGPIGSAYLSRGAAEQLYLAMRLALSDAVSGHMRLPILLDDLFVNFDHTRMTGALSVIHNVTAQHQVIMMTCHDHVVKAAQNKIAGVQIIQL